MVSLSVSGAQSSARVLAGVSPSCTMTDPCAPSNDQNDVRISFGAPASRRTTSIQKAAAATPPDPSGNRSPSVVAGAASPRKGATASLMTCTARGASTSRASP